MADDCNPSPSGKRFLKALPDSVFQQAVREGVKGITKREMQKRALAALTNAMTSGTAWSQFAARHVLDYVVLELTVIIHTLALGAEDIDRELKKAEDETVDLVQKAASNIEVLYGKYRKEAITKKKAQLARKVGKVDAQLERELKMLSLPFSNKQKEAVVKGLTAAVTLTFAAFNRDALPPQPTVAPKCVPSSTH